MKQPTPHTPVSAKSLRGWKYLRLLHPLLDRLHDVGTKRDHAGNRTLHFDYYCALVLLMLFNPIMRSLHSIQRASKLKKVQKKLGCPRTSLGSLSESVTVFDPERLKEIIGELSSQLQVHGRDKRLDNVRGSITLVDGTLLAALPRMAEASLLKGETGSGLVKWHLHTHFEVDRYVPTRIDVTRQGGGVCDERAVLERSVASDHLYVMDRGYAKFALFNQIVAADSSYVCRIRDNSVYDVVEDRPLTEAARAERVLHDAVITLGVGSAKETRPDHRIRLITIQCKPHRKAGRSQRYSRAGSTGPACDGVLRLATNLLDVPAEIIALLYHERWTIEIFFRFFKQILGCRHLLSHSQRGIEIETYCAIIACMLINLWTGKKPTLATREMLFWYFIGMADLDELMEHIASLQKKDDAQK
jgi:hypothetical protein